MSGQRDEAKSIFNLDEFKPYKAPWDERLKILQLRGSYYTGKIYRDTFKTDPWQRMMGGSDRIKGGVKPLYLPLAGAVDIDVGLVPGGWQVDTELVSDEMIMLIRDILYKSNFKTEGTLYVEYGAKYGLTGLKIADLREQRRVELSPVDPTKFMPVFSDGYSQDPELVIYLEMRGYDDEEYEYAEITDGEVIRTYRDGEPYGYDGREPEYKNELGFPPYVQVKHIENGTIYGESTFEKAIPMLNEVNETATHLGEIISKHAEPQWMVVAEPTDLTKSGDNVWFFPEGGDAKPLVAPIDISGVLEFIREIASNVKGALPETSWEELQKKKLLATETLEVQLYPLVIKIKQRCRPNYDDGLERALIMAGKAGVSMGLEGPWQDLANGQVHLDEDREVLPMDPIAKLKLEALQREAEMSEAFMSGSLKMDNFNQGDEEEDQTQEEDQDVQE